MYNGNDRIVFKITLKNAVGALEMTVGDEIEGIIRPTAAGRHGAEFLEWIKFHPGEKKFFLRSRHLFGMFESFWIFNFLNRRPGKFFQDFFRQGKVLDDGIDEDVGGVEG